MATSIPGIATPHEAQAISPPRRCRSCDAPLERLFVDLGMSPPCEDFLTTERLLDPETYYPLDVRVCDRCLLVQLPAYLSPEIIFSEYAYFSSYSDSWVAHAERLVDEAVRRQGLGPHSRVVEVASNDGYLLQHVIRRGIPALGVEPAGNLAAVAEEKGIPILNVFFGNATASQVVNGFGAADYIVANNVFAHIPDLHDFTSGLATLLRPDGLMSIEVAYVVDLIEGNEFDTIYHEHLMYYSIHSAQFVLAQHGLRILDLEHLGTHGGSLRLWVVHDDDPRPSNKSVEKLKTREVAAGYNRADGYDGFAERVERTKGDLLAFLIEERRKGSRIVGYGAPGKASTLLNYCGIRTDLIEFLVDRNPYKQGRYTPGTHIPIYGPDRIHEAQPDVILIMPWNLRTEIATQLAYAREWGARLVVAIPRLEVIE